MNIFNYINKKGSLKEMSDEEFDIFLPEFTTNVVNYGFDNLLKYYTQTLKDIHDDWKNLKKKEIKQDNIASTCIVGMAIIRNFMLHIYDVKNYKNKCIRDCWNYDSVSKAIRMNRKTHQTPYISEIIRQIGFTSGMSKITIYRPILTKRIVNYYNAKEVLDVCVGWGGRMLGACCIPGVYYTGIEPYSITFEKLKDMKNSLYIENVSLYNDTAENVLPSLNKKYDLALTSPPYYNLEIYSNEDTQSHHYGTYNNWIKHFLEPVIKGVLNKLLDNGKSAWSVKNFKTDKTYKLLDDVIRIHEEYGWYKTDKEFSVGNSIRPGMNHDKNGEKRKGQEITYIFEKRQV